MDTQAANRAQFVLLAVEFWALAPSLKLSMMSVLDVQGQMPAGFLKDAAIR